MTRNLESSLHHLKESLLRMGGLVEKSLEIATQCLQSRDAATLKEVHEIEKKINEAHIKVDEDCIKILALQQPLAADLRLIVAVLKINTDLERMGDQAVNIANNTQHYLGGSHIKLISDFEEMTKRVRLMVRKALDSFVKIDAGLARDVLELDDKVDELKNKIFTEIKAYLKTRAEDIEQGLNLILIARNLERIGDHATNIAEDVIYAISGEDIRHSPRRDSVTRGIVK